MKCCDQSTNNIHPDRCVELDERPPRVVCQQERTIIEHLFTSILSQPSTPLPTSPFENTQIQGPVTGLIEYSNRLSIPRRNGLAIAKSVNEIDGGLQRDLQFAYQRYNNGSEKASQLGLETSLRVNPFYCSGNIHEWATRNLAIWIMTIFLRAHV